MSGPIPRAERDAGIDIARGFALLGIILVNAPLFFLPFGSIYDGKLSAPLERSALDWAVQDAVTALAAFKFVSLFSLLFGFGLSLQAAKAAAEGRSRWPLGLRRLGLLLVFGLLHGLLVWYGDILTMYALLGLIVLACIGLPERWLRRATVALAALMAVGIVVFAAFQYRSHTSSAEPPSADAAAMEEPDEAEGPAEHAPTGFDALLAADFEPGSELWIQAETRAQREGPWLDAFAFRAVTFGMGLAISPFSWAWQPFLMMLVGVWVQRSGLFAPQAGARRMRLARRLLLGGLPCALGSVAPAWLFGRESPLTEALQFVFLPYSAMLLSVAYGCLAVELGPRLPDLLRVPVQAAGSMALTVYLSESLVCTAIASWWGLGLFGTMLEAKFTPLVVGVWITLALAAAAWTRRVGDGPMERLWRWGTYGAAR